MCSFYFEKDSLRYVIKWNGSATFNVYLLPLRVPKDEIDVFTVYNIDNIEMAYEEAERWIRYHNEPDEKHT
tara:strand:- start:191 stop:403 length:213 start_codon:yes stop_codon:yes gene_type:complete